MKKVVVIAVTPFVLCASFLGAQAQTPTMVIVPFPPGGALDSVTRIVTQKLSEQTKESFVVENRPGANGLIGAKAAAKAKPDGKTWLFADGAVMTVNPILYPKDPTFEAERDLKVVAALGFQPSLLVVHPDFGPKTIKEFVERAKKEEIPYASGGVGSAGHLTMEYFGSVAGLKLRHVAYKGGAPAMNDLIGGQIPAAFVVFPGALPHVKSGKLIPLAVSSKQRAAELPAVPTVIESGFPAFEVETAFFVMLPGKTPEDTTKTTEEKVQSALSDPAIQKRIRGVGVEPAVKMSPADATKWLAMERDKWSKVIREKGIKAE
jgi:tripartite-type tricarboxylate transporter receptor subunit TctC